MGIHELRDDLTAAIRRVRNGDIEVTHDGVPVAPIVPVRTGSLGDLIAGGEATPPTNRLDLRRLRQVPVTGPMSAGEALELDRSGD